MRQATELKDQATVEVDRARPGLVDLSHRIWGAPELAFEEHRASAWVAEALEAGGFDVDHGGYDLPTAVHARAGSGSLHVTICAEYDALPDIGHACGHNVIAAAAVGAGLALAPLAEALDLTVHVLGTPAEEKGGGKILLLERGAFAGVHAAMMVHPTPTERLLFDTLAVAQLLVRYRGQAAHASMAPHLGVNAADALTVAQVAIGLLRQHLNSGDQVHGIVTHGGSAPNIVPELTEGEFFLRAPSLARLDVLEPRVFRCFEAGAIATGCSHEVSPTSKPYSEFTPDLELAALYRASAEALGRRFDDTPRPAGASTDMANVSLVLPTIHPTLGLDTLPAVNHQAAFTAYCNTPVADEAVRDGALGMAMTCIDAALSPPVRERLLAR
jgi:amidohydrolase